MLEISVAGIVLRFNFSFFAVVGIFLLMDNTGFGIIGLWACLAHEFAHIIAMIIFNVFPTAVVFYGGGIKISERDLQNLTIIKELVVVMAGSFANLIIFAVCFIFTDFSDIYLPVLGLVNLIIGLFNLLPIGYFDGARLVKLLLLKFYGEGRGVKFFQLMQIITGIVVFFLGIYLFYINMLNFITFLVLIYLIITLIIEGAKV